MSDDFLRDLESELRGAAERRRARPAFPRFTFLVPVAALAALIVAVVLVGTRSEREQGEVPAVPAPTLAPGCEPPPLRTTDARVPQELPDDVPALDGDDTDVPAAAFEALRDLDGEVVTASARRVLQIDDGIEIAVVAVRKPRGDRTCSSAGAGPGVLIDPDWAICGLAYANEVAIGAACKPVGAPGALDLRPVGDRVLALALGTGDEELVVTHDRDGRHELASAGGVGAALLPPGVDPAGAETRTIGTLRPIVVALGDGVEPALAKLREAGYRKPATGVQEGALPGVYAHSDSGWVARRVARLFGGAGVREITPQLRRIYPDAHVVVVLPLDLQDWAPPGQRSNDCGSAALYEAFPALQGGSTGEAPEPLQRQSPIAAGLARRHGFQGGTEYWVIPQLRCEDPQLTSDGACIVPVRPEWDELSRVCITPGELRRGAWMVFPVGGTSAAVAGFAPPAAETAVVSLDGREVERLPVLGGVFVGTVEDISGEVPSYDVRFEDAAVDTARVVVIDGARDPAFARDIANLLEPGVGEPVAVEGLGRRSHDTVVFADETSPLADRIAEHLGVRGPIPPTEEARALAPGAEVIVWVGDQPGDGWTAYAPLDP